MANKNSVIKANKTETNRTNAHTWFRLYHELLDDPKIQRLDLQTFKIWINLLCVAARNGGTIKRNIDDLAWSLRVSRETADEAINTLIFNELIDIHDDNTFKPHNWDQRQFRSDLSTERVRKHRAKRNETFQKRDETKNETAPEQKQIQSRTDIAAAAASDIFDWLKDNFPDPDALSEFLIEQTECYGEAKVRAGWQDYKRRLANGEISTHSLATLRSFISSAMPAALTKTTAVEDALQSLRDQFAQEETDA